MQLIDERLILSASVLVNFLECEHLTWLDPEQAHGRLDNEPKRPDSAELLARKGDEHERRHLDALRKDLQAALGNGLAASYPDPVPHCRLCKWSDRCNARRVADAHLSLMARMGRAQITKLATNGVTTVAQLGELTGDDCPPGIGQDTFDRLRQQARLQVDQRTTGRPSYELLEWS